MVDIGTAKILTPIIPFNMIVDTDVGLIHIINKKYKNLDVFKKEVLELELKDLVSLLINREDVNPIMSIMKQPNKEIADEYYKQFFEKEYIDIINNSIATSMYMAISLFSVSEGVNPYVLCGNSIEEEAINSLDFDQPPIIVRGDYNTIDLEPYDPIYFKDFRLADPIASKLNGKNIYIANYPFNTVTYNEEKILLPEVQIKLIDRNQFTITDVYNSEIFKEN